MKVNDLQVPVNWKEYGFDDVAIVLPNGVVVPPQDYIGFDHSEYDQMDQYREQLLENTSITDPVVVTGNDGSDAYWLIAVDQTTYDSL